MRAGDRRPLPCATLQVWLATESDGDLLPEPLAVAVMTAPDDTAPALLHSMSDGSGGEASGNGITGVFDQARCHALHVLSAYYRERQHAVDCHRLLAIACMTQQRQNAWRRPAQVTGSGFRLQLGLDERGAVLHSVLRPRDQGQLRERVPPGSGVLLPPLSAGAPPPQPARRRLDLRRRLLSSAVPALTLDECAPAAASLCQLNSTQQAAVSLSSLILRLVCKPRFFNALSWKAWQASRAEL